MEKRGPPIKKSPGPKQPVPKKGIHDPSLKNHFEVVGLIGPEEDTKSLENLTSITHMDIGAMHGKIPYQYVPNMIFLLKMVYYWNYSLHKRCVRFLFHVKTTLYTYIIPLL
jgi:hypothetical protein